VSRSNCRCAIREWIPRESNPGAEQRRPIVLGKCGGSDLRVRPQNAIRIRYVIGGPAEFLIPTVRELMSNSGSQCQVVEELHRIFRVPCSEPAPKSQFGGIRHKLEGRGCSLKEGCKAGKVWMY